MIDRPNRQFLPAPETVEFHFVGSSGRMSLWTTTALKRAQLKSLAYTLPNTLPRIPTKNGKSSRPDIRKCIERSVNLACYEEDHLISLELGGDPRSPNNLWPEPSFGPWNARVKDKIENKLHDMVCGGQISLRDAQNAIATDWIAAYKKYVGQP